MEKNWGISWHLCTINITLDNLDSTRKVIVSADLIILHGGYRIHDFTVTHRKR